MEVAELVVKIGADLDEVNKGVEAVNDKLDKLKEKNKQGGGFDALEKIATGALHNIGTSATNLIGGALGKIWEFGAGAINMASDYEAAMNRIQVITQATGEQMAVLDATAVNMGEIFGAASAQDAATTLETLTSRGFDAKQAQDALLGTMQLATAGMLDYADAAVIMDNVMSGYKDQAISAADATDILAATRIASGASIEAQGYAYEQFASVANAANVSLKDSATSIGLLEKAGIGGEKAGTALRSALMSLQAPSKEAQRLMESFSISIYDAEGAMKSWPEIIGEFQKLEVGSQVVMRASQDELEKYQKEADATQKRLQALGESNAVIARQMADDQARLAKAAEEYAIRRDQAEEDYRDKVAQLQEDASRKRAELEEQLTNQLATIEQNHADKLEQINQASSEKRLQIEQSYGEKLADITNSYQSKIESITQTFNDKLADAESKLQQKQQQLAADHADKLADIQLKANQKREDLARDLGEKLQDLQASYQRKLADLQASYAQKQADATEKYQSNLEKLETDHLAKLDSIRQKAADLTAQYQINQLRKEQDYQNKLLDLKRDLEKKEKRLADNFAESQLDRQLNHEEKITDIQESYGEKIADIQAKLANTRRKSERDALEKQLTETIAARDKALAKENADFQRAQEQAQRKYDLQLQQAQQAYADQLAELEAKYELEEARRKEDYERQLAAYAQQLEAETKAYSDRREAAKVAFEAQQADLEAQRKAALDQAKQAHADQQAAAQTNYERSLNDLKISIERQIEAERAAYAQRKQQALAAYTEEQNSLAAQRDKALRDAQSDQQKRLSDAQAAYQRQLDELTSSLSKQTQAEQAAYDKQRNQAQIANAQKLADVENNLNQQQQRLDAGYTKQEQRAKEAYERSFSELSGQVHRRATEMQAEMEGNNKAINEQKTKLDTLNKTLSTQGERLVTVTQEMRDNAAVTLFGAEGSSVYHNVIRAGLPAFEEMKQKISAQGKAAELSAAQMRGAAGATAEMSSTIETLQLELGKLGLPTFTDGVRTLTKIIQDNAPSIKAFTKDTIIPLADKALELAKGFIESGDKIKYVEEQLTKYSQPIADAAAGLVTKAAQVAGEQAPAIAKALAMGLLRGFGLNDAAIGLEYLTTRMWDDIKAWWGIHSPSTKMMEIAGYLIDGLWKGLSQAPGKIYDTMADIGGKIKGKITERFGEFTTVGSELLDKVRAGAFNKSGEIYNLMTNIGMQAKDKLAEWYGAMTGVGENLIAGVKSGMERKWNDLKSAVSGWANQLPQWFKNIWDIHSPSGVMEKISGELPAGVEVGVDANADKAVGALSRMSQKMRDVFALPELPPITPYVSDTLAPLAAAPASAIIPRPQAPTIINNYYMTVEGNIWSERDLMEAMRDNLRERGRFNGYEVEV